MNEDIRVTKSFDFAADVTKQLIALSTAIISLCVAFTDKIFSSDIAQAYSGWLLASLISFVFSIISGILTLMALAGHLGNPQNENRSDNQQGQLQQPSEGQPNQSQQTSSPSPIYNGNVRNFSMVQMITFILAIIIAVIYVCNASSASRTTPAESLDSRKYLKVIRVSDYTIENGHVNDTLYLDTGGGEVNEID